MTIFAKTYIAKDFLPMLYFANKPVLPMLEFANARIFPMLFYKKSFNPMKLPKRLQQVRKYTVWQQSATFHIFFGTFLNVLQLNLCLFKFSKLWHPLKSYVHEMGA